MVVSIVLRSWWVEDDAPLCLSRCFFAKSVSFSRSFDFVGSLSQHNDKLPHVITTKTRSSVARGFHVEFPQIQSSRQARTFVAAVGNWQATKTKCIKSSEVFERSSSPVGEERRSDDCETLETLYSSIPVGQVRQLVPGSGLGCVTVAQCSDAVLRRKCPLTWFGWCVRVCVRRMLWNQERRGR